MYSSISLIIRILCGLLIGVVLGLLFDNLNCISLLGTIFDSYENQIDKKVAFGKEIVKED